MNNTLEFIYKRHSVRKFKDQPVPLEDIKRLSKQLPMLPPEKICKTGILSLSIIKNHSANGLSN